MAGHVHRQREAGGRTVDHAALQVFGRCVGDRVDHEIEPTPGRAHRLEYRFQLARLAHVARQQQPAAERLRQWTHVRLGLVVQVGQREFGAAGPHHAGAAPGDAAFVGKAEDKTALTVQVDGCVAHDGSLGNGGTAQCSST